ncbi:EcsC family protein [Bacillus sp. FJAT-45066]|uniref:EcsC family protein n=1 Tax=Bacillus sp. FJAT-45066 TaxID=2011010 RepID=UPI000BB9A082|nr:EcsC family protein [Bacillus sp. FJAT-45066]
MKKIKEITHENMLKALDWSYDTAVNGGIPGVDTAIELAENYLKRKGTLKQKVNRLIRFQNSKSVTSGFLTGLGGVITMPFTIPANITSVILIQMRMVAAIAHMGGYNLKDDEVKSFVYASLAGNGAKDILKNTGVQLGKKLAINGIQKISGATITKINQAVGFRLLTKFGQTGVINLGKMVPLVGGVIGGTVDGVTTNIVGNIARNLFIDGNEKEELETIVVK